MVRPGEVIAQGLGREVPEEARARVAHLAQVREGVRDAQLQVLRRDQVRKVKGGIQVLGKEDGAVVFQRGAGDLRAGERRELRRQLRLTAVARASLVVMRMGAATLSCSAWERRSAAT